LRFTPPPRFARSPSPSELGEDFYSAASRSLDFSSIGFR
jgi:hypothetical protein